MFGSIDKSKGYRFCTYDLSQSLQGSQQKMREEIESLDGNRLLNTAATDLAAYFVEKYRVEPITLLQSKWYADTKEVRVDVRHDQMRWINDRSRPVLVPGERTEVRIPHVSRYAGYGNARIQRTSVRQRGSRRGSVINPSLDPGGQGRAFPALYRGSDRGPERPVVGILLMGERAPTSAPCTQRSGVH